VKLLARGETLKAIQADGLIYEANGRRRALKLEAAADPAAFGVADHVVVTLKGQAMPEVGPTLAPLIGPDTAIVSAMNGVPWWFLDGFGGPLAGQALESVDPGGRLKAQLPVSRVIGCVVHASAVAEAPGVVRLVGADKLTFGEPDGASTPRLERLIGACRDAGMNTLATADVRLDIWAKLWGNMSMNPLSALTRATTGRMLDDPEVNQLIIEMMIEMAAVGHDIGLDLGMTTAERMVVTRKLGDFKTSMLRDAEAGRALEVDGLLGVLVEMADRLERPVPFLRAVHGMARVLSASLTAS
jgi:2-dehydropantoate 2-reductase